MPQTSDISQEKEVDEEAQEEFNRAVDAAIAAGNKMLAQGEGAATRAIASGLLSGAIHFWLFSRAPCPDKLCEGCLPFATSDERMKRLNEEANEYAPDSEYFHTPNDHNAGTA